MNNIVSCVVLISLLLTGCSVVMADESTINDVDSHKRLQDNQWNHGSEDCKENNDPAIEVFRYDQSSYILRQNKCLNFEAPFMYLLFGQDKIVLIDTGATESAVEFPLHQKVMSLIEEQSQESGFKDRFLIVLHSHGHGDHRRADSQFQNKQNVVLVTPDASSVRKYFSFSEWPQGQAKLDLGGRELTVIPSPGHQEEAITIYDSHTKWLLTGDTIYPGYIYVKNWQDYKNTIARLVGFSKEHEVTAVLGAHIEMRGNAGEIYPIGSTYQPNEASLVLGVDHLKSLNQQLLKGRKAKKIEFDSLIVAPMSFLQRSMSNLFRRGNN